MGRPLKKKNFGANLNNNIKVQFHNGVSSIKGYIVKQYSSRKFKCSDEAGITKVCKLVDKLSGDLAAGEMTITLKADGGYVEQAVKISQNLVTVVYTGTNYVTGGTHATGVYGQAKWSYSTSTSDTYWQIEEVGTTTNLVAATGAVDLEGDDIDVTYPLPGSGTYKTAATALLGVSYADVGSVTTATGSTSTVSNSVDGLVRSKYNGNFSSGATANISTWDFSFFSTATHLADVVDTDVSWGQQTDGDPLGQHNFSIEWKGYVKVPTTQKYNFYTESDDENAIWIGSNAVSGLSNSNYDAWNQNKSMPGQAASCVNQNSLSMDSTKWYPVRLWFTEFTGGCKFQIYAIGADGTKLNGADLEWCHNGDTNGYNP